MHVVVPRLNVEVTAMPRDLRSVVIKVGGVVVSRLTPTEVGVVRLMPVTPMRRCHRLIDVAIVTMTVSPTVTKLSFCLTAEGECESGDECECGEELFRVEHD